MCCRTQTAIKGPFIFQRATSIIKTKHLQLPVICKECATFQHVKFILMSYSRVHRYFSVSFLPKAPLDSVTNVCGWKNPSILLTTQHLNHRLQNCKLLCQLTMSRKCGAISGFLLVFSDIINLFQTLFYTHTQVKSVRF